MESLELVQSNRRLRAVRLAITMGLAALFLVALLCGLRGVTLVYADPDTLYVDGASGNDTPGCTRESPCATISYALDQAADFDEIWVAQGTYIENLVINKTVTLKGGYEPVGWSRSLRRYTTTIDGNQSGRVINVQSKLSETTVIDGFTITNGDGGIGILLSSVAIQNSKIVDNDRTGWGSGGITMDRSYVTITNTLIADNHDGAMLIISTPVDPWVESVVHINNSTIANNGGHGIFCSLSWCIVVNSIVWGHEGEDFAGELGRCLVTYSDIEMMEWPGEGNISEDPRFVDPDCGDYHLRPDSPCIDAGNNDDAPETDWEGNPRPLDGDRDGTAVTDMGADELLPYRIYLPIIFKCCPGLDEHASEWGIYREGSPTCVNPENVPTPSLDGNALRFAIAGGNPYGNCHYYRNLPSQPCATQFTYTLSFWFTPTTTCNNIGGSSIIQALEFSMSKWYQSQRYEFALQWQNVGDGAPQWRYWDPNRPLDNRWVPMNPPITQCLKAGQWYTFTLEGKIITETQQVHYQSFTIGDDNYILDVTTSPITIPGELDRLAVAVQLDGNFEESPYDVLVDRVCLRWSPE